MITGAIIGNRELVQRLSSMPDVVRAELRPEVQRWTFAVEARSKANYLTGPRPLHLGVVTGRLRSSISDRIEETPTSIYGYVGTNVSYGELWELGFKRKVGAGARGGPRTLTGGALARYFAKHPPGVKDVAARPFLKPALDDLRSQIVGGIQAAQLRGMRKALGQ